MKIYYPERIICLTEETTETLYLLGEQDRIIGVSGFTVRPAIARKDKPKISTFIDAKIDKICDLKPDLVIGFSDIQGNIAKELILLAKNCGADVAKFQKRNSKELLPEKQYNAPHPNPSNSYGATYGEHREFLEFSKKMGNDLTKDYPQYNFKGLKLLNRHRLIIGAYFFYQISNIRQL